MSTIGDVSFATGDDFRFELFTWNAKIPTARVC